MGGKLCQKGENTVEKGAIVCSEQFLLFSALFSKDMYCVKRRDCLGVNIDLEENIVGKGENAGNQHFLLFPQCFQRASSSGSLKVGIV